MFRKGLVTPFIPVTNDICGFAFGGKINLLLPDLYQKPDLFYACVKMVGFRY